MYKRTNERNRQTNIIEVKKCGGIEVLFKLPSYDGPAFKNLHSSPQQSFSKSTLSHSISDPDTENPFSLVNKTI